MFIINKANIVYFYITNEKYFAVKHLFYFLLAFNDLCTDLNKLSNYIVKYGINSTYRIIIGNNNNT